MPNETLEKLRAEAAINASGYSRDAKQFAASGQYATAENMRCMSEAWGIVAMWLGNELSKGRCSEGDLGHNNQVVGPAGGRSHTNALLEG